MVFRVGVVASLLVLTACATTGATVGSGVGDRFLEHPPYYAGGSAGGALPSVVWRAAGWTGCVLLVVAVQALGAIIAFTQWTTAAPAPAESVTGADVGAGGYP